GAATDRPAALRRAAALAARQAGKLGAGALAFHAADLDAKAVENVAVGLALGAWEYKDLKTLPPEAERRAPLTKAEILVADERAAQAGLEAGRAVAPGHDAARRLAIVPGNPRTP